MADLATPRDCFISHASEDKDAVARPLAEALMQAGYEVWFDEYELVAGESLRQRIDEGLAASRFGVVVLSTAFFDKRWPQSELNGLFAKEVVGDERLILPVWHGVDEEFLATKSPMLADRVGVRSEPFDKMVEKIIRAIEHRKDGATAAAIVAAQTPAKGPALPEPVELVEDVRGFGSGSVMPSGHNTPRLVVTLTVRDGWPSWSDRCGFSKTPSIRPRSNRKSSRVSRSRISGIPMLS